MNPVTAAYRIDLAGRPVVVVGGDGPALGHIAELLDAGASVTVVAETAVATVEDLADRGLIVWHRHAFTVADLDYAWLAVAATADPRINTTIALEAEARRILTVRVDAAPTDSIATAGRVVLVGGGPGDPGLLTLAGKEAIEKADVIVTDRLAPLAALQWARPDAEIIDVAKVPGGRSTSQEEINRLLVEHAKSGKNVVRFKGGDSFVFGRGGEELIACLDVGIAAHVIPGVTSAIAAPAAVNIPVTHRGVNQGFTVISGHVLPDDPESTLDYAALARSGTSLVLLMAVRTLPAIAVALIEGGMDPETPAAIIADGAMPSQNVVRATVGTIAEAARESGIKAPAVTVIGGVAAIDGLL
ncbi:MAG: uroporphyrinogen-III C-methyltransferase [Actinomycetota bacterium]|nr:uroporphyrinogen-III C-methyltransferase [Actinomycetota bacterium]